MTSFQWERGRHLIHFLSSKWTSKSIDRNLMLLCQKANNGLLMRSPFKVLFFCESPVCETTWHTAVLSRSHLKAFQADRKKSHCIQIPFNIWTHNRTSFFIFYNTNWNSFLPSIHHFGMANHRENLWRWLTAGASVTWQFFFWFPKYFSGFGNDSWIFKLVLDLYKVFNGSNNLIRFYLIFLIW